MSKFKIKWLRTGIITHIVHYHISPIATSSSLKALSRMPPLTRFQKRRLGDNETGIEQEPNQNRDQGFDIDNTTDIPVAKSSPSKKRRKMNKTRVASIPVIHATKRLTKNTRKSKGKERSNSDNNGLPQDSNAPSHMLEGLPSEILLSVFSYLTPSQLLPLGTVSRRLKNVVDDAPIWEHIWRKCELKKPARKRKTYLAVVVSESQKICEKCYSKTKANGSNSPISIFDEDAKINIRMCRDCRCKYYAKYPEPNPEQLTGDGSQSTVNGQTVTKSTAKEIYKLTDMDLEELYVTYVRNPHYRTAAPMHLYDKEDVIRLARQAHGGDVGIKAARTATSARGRAIRDTRRLQVESRTTLLTERLEQAGLTLREDSRLCQQYIDNGHRDVDEIVTTMKEMAWYFRCTDYETLRVTYEEEYDYGDRSWGWGRTPRMRSTIDSETGKNLALNKWIRDRIFDEIYTPVKDDPDNDNRPPMSLWGTINGKWMSQLKSHAAAKLNAAYRKQYPNFIELVSSGRVPDKEENAIQQLIDVPKNQPPGHINSHTQFLGQVLTSANDIQNDAGPSSIPSSSNGTSQNSVTVANSSVMSDSTTHKSVLLSQVLKGFMGQNWYKTILEMSKTKRPFVHNV